MSDFSIRTSRYRRLFTAPPGLSQCPTSFFGIQRQGIPRKLLVAFHVMQGTGPSSGLSVLLSLGLYPWILLWLVLFLSVSLHSRFGLHTVFGCQRSCGLYDLSDSLFLKLREARGDLWRLGDSNPWPMPCKGTALPAELNPLNPSLWAFQDSNLRPRPYQRRALTS